MNREQAAKKLKMSVRSLQRAVAAELKKPKEERRLNVVYKRGASGKQEAVFDPKEVTAYKHDIEQATEREPPPEPPESAALIPAPTGDASRQTQFVALVTAVREIIQATPAQLPPAHAEVSLSDLAVKPLLKIDEAAHLTGLSRATLREAIESGTLKAKIVGRAWRIKRPDLDAYIKSL
jgi:excisionase family DNA binding protein